MNRRTFLSSVMITPALAAVLAACGDDSKPAAVDTGGSSGPTTTASAQGIPYPTGADDVIVRWGIEGGFVVAGFAFTNVPSLLITGDGQVFSPGATALIYPGPLLPNLAVGSITPQGIEKILELAKTAGLLAPPPEYFAEVQVADVPDTVLVLGPVGGPYRHQANALGFQTDENGNPAPELTPEREKLYQFVTLLGTLSKITGEQNLGTGDMYAPTEFRMQSRVVTKEEFDSVESATMVDWPAEISVRLADALTCARVSGAAATKTLNDAKQNTYFKDADVLYSLAAVGVLPGDPAC